jgi:hypothetical protein
MQMTRELPGGSLPLPKRPKQQALSLVHGEFTLATLAGIGIKI